MAAMDEMGQHSGFHFPHTALRKSTDHTSHGKCETHHWGFVCFGVEVFSSLGDMGSHVTQAGLELTL